MLCFLLTIAIFFHISSEQYLSFIIKKGWGVNYFPRTMCSCQKNILSQIRKSREIKILSFYFDKFQKRFFFLRAVLQIWLWFMLKRELDTVSPCFIMCSRDLAELNLMVWFLAERINLLERSDLSWINSSTSSREEIRTLKSNITRENCSGGWVLQRRKSSG